jgi:Mn2+/Fe2+ NRAMP family transporter
MQQAGTPPRQGWARRIWKALGPGLVTGAADDDPSGIATYSQAGAQYGYALTWTMLLTMPFMAGIQIISACIGWRTGRGLAKSLAGRFPHPVVHALVALLVAANTINVAADLAAMGESLRLAVAGPAVLYALLFGLGCLIAQILVPYHRYAGYLKYLTMALLVYVGAALTLHIPWGRVGLAVLTPSFAGTQAMQLTVVAVFGTTISPYLFFWQASQEAEESQLSHRRRRPGASRQASGYFRRISLDTWAGMAFSNCIGFFIIVTTAATLNAHGVTTIDTASQAAEALRPLAGELTFILFAAGIIGTGLLAVPVLTGSAAYALADVLGLKGSLELPARRAGGFYAILAVATVAGAALAALRLNPIRLLFWAAVINGIAAVPIMVAMMILVSGRRGIEAFRIPGWLRALGWLAAALMTVAVAVYFRSLLR